MAVWCSSTHFFERVLGRERQRFCYPQSLLPADGVRRTTLVRKVSTAVSSASLFGMNSCEIWLTFHVLSPSRLLDLTGVIVLGVGDSLV